MPVYEYSCECGKVFARVLKLADYLAPQEHCAGKIATKLISAPAIRGDYAGYDCPVTGQRIEGRKAHLENLRRTGCRLLEPGETSDYKKNVSREDEQLEARVEATADELIIKMPTEKRDRLAAEMEHGLSVEVVRN